jgi:hypothetical protein
MKWFLAVSLAFLVLAGCQNTSTTVRESSTSNIYQQLQGAGLVLKQAVSVPAGKARAFVQDGEVRSGFDSYKPHCAFEISTINHDGFTIEADAFAINRVQSQILRVVSAEPIRLAGLQLTSGIGGAGGSSSYYDGYHFWLSSVKQPEVRRMSCFGVYAQPYELYAPTMEDIRQTLGSLAEIRR